MSVAHIPVVAAALAITLLYFTHLESGDVLAAFVCLALAHRARGSGDRVGGYGVLGFEEVEHRNSGRKGAEMSANDWRDKIASLTKLYAPGPMAFER